MLNKRGIIEKEIPELILGAVIFFLLAGLLYNLMSPDYAIADETAESYFKSFMEQVAVADSGGVGSFSIWLPENEKEKRKFYLVYFGGSSSYGNGLNFYSLGNNVNHICGCFSEDGDVSCDFCENLDYPVFVDGIDVDDVGRWAIGVGEKIEIVLKEGVYEIRKV